MSLTLSLKLASLLLDAAQAAEAVVVLNFVGAAVRDALDPRMAR